MRKKAVSKTVKDWGQLFTSTVSLKELLLVLQVKYDTPQVFLNTNEPFVWILFDKFTINHINEKLLVLLQINAV